jgi:hypothetical protein
MQSPPDTSNWLRVNLLKALLALALIVACALAFIVIGDPPGLNIGLRLIRDTIPSAIVVLLAYLFGSWLLSRAGLAAPQQLKEEIVETVASSMSKSIPAVLAIYNDIIDVPWGKFFDSSERVQIVGRFFDGPVGISYRSAVGFFRRGGFMLIITVDPRADEAMKITNDQRNIEQRTHEDDVRYRLISGLRVIDKAREEAGCATDRVEVFLLPFATNYSAYCFDDKDLIINPTEHFFLSVNRSPRVHFDLRMADGMRRFWRHETEAATRHSLVVSNLAEYLKDL